MYCFVCSWKIIISNDTTVKIQDIISLAWQKKWDVPLEEKRGGGCCFNFGMTKRLFIFTENKCEIKTLSAVQSLPAISLPVVKYWLACGERMFLAAGASYWLLFTQLEPFTKKKKSLCMSGTIKTVKQQGPERTINFICLLLLPFQGITITCGSSLVFKWFLL